MRLGASALITLYSVPWEFRTIDRGFEKVCRWTFQGKVLLIPPYMHEAGLRILRDIGAQKGSLQVSVSGGLCSSVCGLTLGRIAGLGSALAIHRGLGFQKSILEWRTFCLSLLFAVRL